jgi:hypothetical protein
MAVRGAGGAFVESIRVAMGCRSRLSSKHALGWTEFIFLPSRSCHLWLCDPENIGPSIRSLGDLLFHLPSGFYHNDEISVEHLTVSFSVFDNRIMPPKCMGLACRDGVGSENVVLIPQGTLRAPDGIPCLDP